MSTVEWIYRKRQGESLSPAEIEELVAGYVRGKIPDYQISAFLMAVFFRGLSHEELQALTGAMMRSGEIFDWSKIPGRKSDKHSTGGVGDKVSLILAPLAAACGLVVPMVSGRGLGHTGGTLDKLEAIPGFKVDLSRKRIEKLLRTIGVAMAGQNERFVPADKKLYALRDVTATVESIPLICASIMSKKLAEGCESLVLDIKVGSGAFMKTRKDARELGRAMISLGTGMGRKVSALLTDMSQPTGHAIGNANEVIEAIECLRGEWPADLKKMTFALTGKMLTISGVAKNQGEAEKLMETRIADGSALNKFRAMVEAQGGDPRVVDDPRRLKLAPKEAAVPAPRAGWIAAFETREIGLAASALGAGRQTKEDKIDSGVGLWLHAKIGDRIEKGEPLFTLCYRKDANRDATISRLQKCVTIADEKTRPPKTIIETLG